MSMRYPGGFITATAPTVNANTAKGVWTLEQAMQYVKAGQWPIPTGGGDPYFGSNTLLLPGQGTNGAQNNTFLDSSTNNFTITRNGNTTQGTFTPFSHSDGYWGNYFGTSAHFLNVANNAALNLSGGAYTIEGWVYPNGNYGFYNVLVAKRIAGGSASSAWEVFLNISTGVLAFYNGTQYNSTITPPSNQWSHFAAVYSGTELSLYLNGSRVFGPTTITNTDYSADPVIGSYATAGGAYEQLFGYLSNVRITKGAALYTGATYTVPTGPLTTTVSSGTVSLLTCQSNIFKDNSVNAAAITATGSPSIQTFQPFGAPTSAYSAATFGGSGYFDGTGDWLTSATSGGNCVLSGNFTVESWVYPTSWGAYQRVISGGASTFYWSLGFSTTWGGGLKINWFDGADYYSSAYSQGSPLNTWYHLAVVRTGSTIYYYINGVQYGTSSYSATPGNANGGYMIGNRIGATEPWFGYMTDSRVVLGTNVYGTGSTITIPTAPLTAVSGTSLLLNYTNAGIIDNAVSNNLETVGSASISTTQYKWGSSSMYFDGSGDWLITNSQVDPLNFGAGDFTIEFWLYLNSTGTQVIFDGRRSSASDVAPMLYYLSGLKYYTAGGDRITGSTLNTGQWYHIAIARCATSTKMFINGLQTGSTYTDSNSYVQQSQRPLIGAEGVTVGSSPLNGYINDLRIAKGYARYLYNFTAPTAAFPLFWQAAATPSSDPYFENTTLLLPGNGTNGAQNNTFLDSSTNAFTITRNGNTTQGTFTPFSKDAGRWGNYFDGSSYLTSSSSTAFNSFVTGSSSGVTFTIEAFVFPTATVNGANPWQGAPIYVKGTTYLNFHIQNNKLRLYWYDQSATAQYVESTASIPLNQWTQVGVTVNGSAVTMYVNGVASGTGTFNGINTSGVGGAELIGYQGASGNTSSYYGYISNLRVSNVVRTITASTSPLTSDANTIYLTCQSNRFVDNSSNGYTFTATGTPSVQAFSPFPTTAAYSAGTNGGSGYFDGTGDYLTLPSGAAFQFGTGNFTVECWFYVSATGLQYLFDARNSGQTNAWALHVTPSSGNIVWFNGSADWTVNTTLRINSWNHIAYVRETTTGSMFLNGVRLSTQTDSTNYSVSPTTSTIAARNNNVENVNGYLADVRVVKGTAVYSGTTYTVPTAPLTAITNTSLLLSGTNGGIIDNTMSNNLETVGGASISTTQSKWGGSSMFFDGNGDYLIMPNVLTGQFRTGDFTIEYWDFHGTQGTNYADQVGNLSSASPSGTWRFGTFSNLGGLYFAYHNGSAYVDVVFGSAAYNDSAWRHFAISRYNGVLIAFVNGIQVGAVTACTQDFNSSNRVILGAELVNPTYFTGYLQDVRVTKGIARYVQNFTPPIQAFQLL